MKEVKGSDKSLVITMKTFYGFEQVLQEELAELGYNDSKKLNRAVQINGS